MTTPDLITDIERDEGCELNAYRDSVGVWTIGYGHTPATPGERWTQAECDETLRQDIAAHTAMLDRVLPWWRTLDDVRQDALANMAFNLGVEGLLGFHNTLTAIQRGQYASASVNMLMSKWAAQVGARATRLAAMMKSGVRP